MKAILFLSFLIITNFIFSGIVLVTNTNDTGAGSLRDAIANANEGDTIKFNQSLISGGNDTVILASEISINKPLTLMGAYNNLDTLFISGLNTVNLFNINLLSPLIQKK